MVSAPHVSPELTALRLEEILQKHEQIRIREFWEDVLLKPSGEKAWLNAFKNKVAGDHLGLTYLRSSALRTALGTNMRGQELTEHLRQLPLATQRSIVEALRPNTRGGLDGIVVTPGLVYAPDFRAMLRSARTPECFVVELVRTMRDMGTPLYHAQRYMELLLMLWARNLVLFPADLKTWRIRNKWETLRNERYTGSKTALVQAVTDAMKGTTTSEFQSRTYGLLTSSSLAASTDLCLDLIATYEADLLEATAHFEGQALYSEKSFATRVGQLYRLLFNQAYPSFAVARTQTRTAKSKSNEQLKGDGTFVWLETTAPALQPWADLMRRFVAQLKTARLDGHIGRLNSFADYLLSLENPPRSPFELRRQEHIFDATLKNSQTYCEYLRIRMKRSVASTSLSLLRRFFDWYVDYLLASGANEAGTFVNPVLSTDTLGSDRRDRSGQTARNALPGYVLEEIKAVLVENDFAFGKAQPNHYVRVLDRQTGLPTRTWFPAPTVCLYLMLEAPLRSHQARWMDSGELDALVLDAVSGKLVQNPSPYAIAGRREAALRLQHDTLRSTDWLGLWVNTNKTVMYDRDEVGYCIPYVSERLSTLLKGMAAWQVRYNLPMTAPIPYYGEKHSSEERKRIADKGPQVTPLFRDPATNREHAPITYDRLVTFYTKALAEVQRRIKVKYGHDVRLVTEDDKGELKWVVDLHTLRVSGITAMIESGVPLEVVSQFVAGHTTLVMTLHYLKFSPLKLRQILKDAHDKSLETQDFVGSESFLQNLDSFSPFLLGQDGAGQGAGMGALKEKTGIINITSEGICPGTSCSTGGPVDSTRISHGPVPGGQRCGLCRYWITGPAHLLGQVAAVNNLAYTIRKKGLQVADLNDERLDAEDAGAQKRARHLRDRVDLLNRELAIDVEEWAARYRYAEQSVSLLNEYLATKAAVEGAAVPVPLLTAGTAAELKITLEEAHEFALLDQITQMSDFVTGFSNREAEVEKNAILSKMLAANGVKPFLLTLSEEQAHEAGNLLSALLLQQVKHSDLDDVLNGHTKLSAYPLLAERLRALETEVPSVFRLPGAPGYAALSFAC
ncbi:VPA1269 family protein [Ralstonia solanacearum]|uniref:VPA1269 family protein n=1 Tax=Ralstonia solanacearum TaxID=305 RepID=UPI003513B73E